MRIERIVLPLGFGGGVYLPAAGLLVGEKRRDRAFVCGEVMEWVRFGLGVRGGGSGRGSGGGRMLLLGWWWPLWVEVGLCIRIGIGDEII